MPEHHSRAKLWKLYFQYKILELQWSSSSSSNISLFHIDDAFRVHRYD